MFPNAHGASPVRSIPSTSLPQARVRFRCADAHEGEFPPPRSFEVPHATSICGNPRMARVASRIPSPHRDALRAMRMLISVALAVLLCGAGLAFAGADALQGSPKGSVALTASSGESTPPATWKRGSMPYVYQTDGAWADIPYAGGCVGTHGCGPTCMSMVSVYLTGKVRTPDELCRLSEDGGFVDAEATSWLYMTDGAARLGLQGRELPASEDVMRAQLRMGHPIICSMGPGDFTTIGHFIVLVDEAPDGTIEIRDPNSPERSSRTWELSRILGQCRNLWAFSAEGMRP